MSEERPPYASEHTPILVTPGTAEARLVELYRRAQSEKRSARRWLFVAITPEGAAFLLRGEPAGKLVSDN